MKDSLKELVGMMKQLKSAQEEAEQCELDLKRAETKRDFLAEEKIPELIAEVAELLDEDIDSDFQFAGMKLQLKDKFKFCTISEKNRPSTFDWMDDNGHGGMIKREIIVSFDREQEEEARALQERLRDDYPGVKEHGAIHSSTLRSWVKNRLEKGDPIPEGISYEIKKVAKVT
jgi:hypothetical protein